MSDTESDEGFAFVNASDASHPTVTAAAKAVAALALSPAPVTEVEKTPSGLRLQEFEAGSPDELKRKLQDAGVNKVLFDLVVPALAEGSIKAVDLLHFVLADAAPLVLGPEVMARLVEACLVLSVASTGSPSSDAALRVMMILVRVPAAREQVLGVASAQQLLGWLAASITRTLPLLTSHTPSQERQRCLQSCKDLIFLLHLLATNKKAATPLSLATPEGDTEQQAGQGSASTQSLSEVLGVLADVCGQGDQDWLQQLQASGLVAVLLRLMGLEPGQQAARRGGEAEEREGAAVQRAGRAARQAESAAARKEAKLEAATDAEADVKMAESEAEAKEHVSDSDTGVEAEAITGAEKAVKPARRNRHAKVHKRSTTAVAAAAAPLSAAASLDMAASAEMGTATENEGAAVSSAAAPRIAATALGVLHTFLQRNAGADPGAIAQMLVVGAKEAGTPPRYITPVLCTLMDPAEHATAQHAMAASLLLQLLSSRPRQAVKLLDRPGNMQAIRTCAKHHMGLLEAAAAAATGGDGMATARLPEELLPSMGLLRTIVQVLKVLRSKCQEAGREKVGLWIYSQILQVVSLYVDQAADGQLDDTADGYISPDLVPQQLLLDVLRAFADVPALDIPAPAIKAMAWTLLCDNEQLSAAAAQVLSKLSPDLEHPFFMPANTVLLYAPLLQRLSSLQPSEFDQDKAMLPGVATAIMVLMAGLGQERLAASRKLLMDQQAMCFVLSQVAKGGEPERQASLVLLAQLMSTLGSGCADVLLAAGVLPSLAGAMAAGNVPAKALACEVVSALAAVNADALSLARIFGVAPAAMPQAPTTAATVATADGYALAAAEMDVDETAVATAPSAAKGGARRPRGAGRGNRAAKAIAATPAELQAAAAAAGMSPSEARKVARRARRAASKGNAARGAEGAGLGGVKRVLATPTDPAELGVGSGIHVSDVAGGSVDGTGVEGAEGSSKPKRFKVRPHTCHGKPCRRRCGTARGKGPKAAGQVAMQP